MSLGVTGRSLAKEGGMTKYDRYDDRGRWGEIRKEFADMIERSKLIASCAKRGHHFGDKFTIRYGMVRNRKTINPHFFGRHAQHVLMRRNDTLFDGKTANRRRSLL